MPLRGDRRRRSQQRQADWKQAVLGAHALRMVHDRMLYGLLEGGPTINLERCDELIRQGKEKGVSYTDAEVTSAAVGFVSAFNEEAAKRVDERTD